MRPVVGTALRRQLEDRTIRGYGIPAAVLMERAALAVAEEAQRFLSNTPYTGPERTVLCVCGTGNNGGDGIAAARILSARGYKACIFAPGEDEKRSDLNRAQLFTARRMGVAEVSAEDIPGADVIIDALFGIGLTRAIRAPYADYVGMINRSCAYVISVDIPSGIDADTGRIPGECVRADVTVTMQHALPGILVMPGAKYAGRIVTADAGIADPEKKEAAGRLVDLQDLQAALPQRDEAGNKGTFGKVLLVAGSEGMCGAAFLAGRAAFAAGAGMVRILTPACNRVPLQTMLPEAIVDTYTGPDEAGIMFDKAAAWADVIAAGPGLSCCETARMLVSYAFTRTALPLVVDADGLNLLAEDLSLLQGRNDVFLTPHIGEMARLTGKSIPQIKEDLIGTARTFARETGAYVHLKDARSVSANPDGAYDLCAAGNSGMACAGSGDVLCGLTAGLLARGCAHKDVLGCAHYVHASGGDTAAGNKGPSLMTARDIIEGAGTVLWKAGR